MKPDPANPSLLRRAWGRRWVRRVTYLLASGAVVTGLVGWGLQQPMVDRWIVARLDEAIRKETGLAFHAERLEIHPFQGRILLHDFSLGGDLLRARLLEVDVDPLTFLRTHTFRHILLESPRILLDRERLGRLHLREHKPSAAPPTWQILRLEIRDGQAGVDEPAWGIHHGTCSFNVDGRGRQPNQVWLDVRAPHLALGDGPGHAEGDLGLKFRYTDQGIDTANVHARLGDNGLKALGSYEFTTGKVSAELTGGINLGEFLRILKQSPSSPASGFLDLRAKVHGTAAAPLWHMAVEGRNIQVKDAPLRPGTLQIAAAGSPGRIHLDRLGWDSPDGRLRGEATWTRNGGTSLEVSAEDVALTHAAGYARTDLVKGLTGRFKVAGTLPTPPWVLPDLGKLKATGSGQFMKEGQRVGSVEFSVADSQLRARNLDFLLPEFGFAGSVSARLSRRGLASLEAEGDVDTDAELVAGTLRAWHVVDLDMAGSTSAHATFQWDPQGGTRLDGHAQVEGPRWHGAHADRVSTDITIRGKVLRITDIELEKGEGRGYGDIWITWAPLPPGEESIDMCFRAFRLPIREGLRAADQGDLRIDGIGSGWARLHGPAHEIVMEGQAVAEKAEVFGLLVPAASSNFFMDLRTTQLKATELRVADSLDHLEGAPGTLDLRGSMDMKPRESRWTADLQGRLDSSVLGLKGPLVRGRVEGRLEGPLSAPLGPIQVPEGAFTLTDGSLSMDGQNVGGVEARLAFRDGHVQATAGFAGKDTPILDLEAVQSGPKRLSGELRVNLGPASADTAEVSSRLTQGFLRDLALDLRIHGDWTPAGLGWKGQARDLVGTFDGFQLVQARPSTFQGDTSGMDLHMGLEGRSTAAQGVPSPRSTTMNLEGRLPFDPEGRLDLRLAGTAELANLKAIADHLVDPGQYSLMADMKPAGSATFNINLGGKPLEPSLEGRLDLTGGRLSARTYPQSIENVDFSLLFHGRDITIPQEAPLKGTLAQGALSAWGRISWGARGLTNYDVNATLDDFQFRDLPEGFEVQGAFNGSLRGNDRDGGLLKGTIHAKSMLYQTDFNLTDIILASAFGSGGGLSSMDPSDPLARIELDLDLVMDRPWEFDTNYLKLQGRPTGAFKFMGNLAHPGLKGRMELLPGGRITGILPAGDLFLERGSVEFADPAVFNPILDLHGRVDVDPYLVTLDISGTLNAIKANPSSTPALRPDEIFAILVDPSAVNKVGAAQGATSQTAVSTGIFNQGAGLLTSLFLANGLERLRKTLNLDRVNFAISGGSNLSLTLEKSWDVLGHRIPLLYNQKQEGTQTTLSGNIVMRFGNFVLQVGARQVTGSTQTPGDTTVQGIQPSGEIRYTWTPK